jgi:Mor family transcriptional regulator
MGDLFKALFGAFAGPLFLFAGFAILLFTLHSAKIDIVPVLSFIVALSPIWVPIGLFHIFFERWQDYTGLKFQDDNGRVTLRIKPPQEVFKSPEAMESVFAQIYNSYSRDNLVQSYVDGKRPLTYSFEIANVGGEVRFYMNVPRKKIKNALEAQLYAQYPGIEVVEEVVDYTAEVKNDLTKHDYMAFHFVKKGKEEVLPIKTYIDYGLDRMPKEEEKFEPMAPLLEHIGKCKPHERIWVQFLCTPHVEQNFKNGFLQEKPTWEKAAKATIKKIMTGETSHDTENPETPSRLTMGERDLISAIERNVGKYAYETVIRAMYITLDKDKFDGDMIGPILRGMSQWDIIGRNGIGLKWRTDFDWPWFQDPSGSRKKFYKRRELDFYKGRNFLPGDVKNFGDNPKVMSVEELASMYHIPGKSVVTPSLTRVESIRRNAPANLPISNQSNPWS